MDNLCLVIRRGPYGTLSAAEGVRHFIGAIQAGMSATVILVDDGVYVAKEGQNAEDTGWTNLSSALGKALASRAPGSSTQARAYVHRRSAEIRGLDDAELIVGVESIDDDSLAAVIASADALLIF